MPPVPPAAPCHPWAEHIPPLPVDDTDPYWLWLSGMTTIASASVVVKCRDCRHCDPNSHSPGFGWSTCVILHHGGWPAKPRTCQHFEPKDGVTEAMRVVIRMLEESVGTLSTTPTGEAA
jgi:hypothetical protein